MTPKQIAKIIEELRLLRADVNLIVEAAKNTESLLLMLAAGEQPRQTACEWLREEKVQMWPAN